MILVQLIPPGESVQGNIELFMKLQIGLKDAGKRKSMMSTAAEELERVLGKRKTHLVAI